MTVFGRACATAVILLSGASAIFAQAPVDVGARVRLEQRVSPRMLTGVVAGADSLSLRLQPDYEAGIVQVRWSDIDELEVSRGYRGPGPSALRGGRIGLLVGLGTGAALIGAGLLLDRSTECGDCMMTHTGLAVMAVLPLTAVTTLVGLVVGSGTAGEVWQEVDLRR